MFLADHGAGRGINLGHGAGRAINCLFYRYGAHIKSLPLLSGNPYAPVLPRNPETKKRNLWLTRRARGKPVSYILWFFAQPQFRFLSSAVGTPITGRPPHRTV